MAISKIKVELNHAGFRELLKSKELEAGLKEVAAGIASRAGSGYGSDTKTMSSRVIASAYTSTAEAARECSREAGDPLLRALR